MTAANAADARASLLARLRARSGEPQPVNLAHPLPALEVDLPPLVRSHLLDPDDLPGSFVRNATAAGATVRSVRTSAEWPAVLDAIVERHRVRRAVASKQRDAWPVVEALGARGSRSGRSTEPPRRRRTSA